MTLSNKTADGAALSSKDKRFISVEDPENTGGNVEYKRQLINCSASRLEKLKTQMSYRLDEGNGICVYKIGVEDDGCHSLIDYKACAETAKVLEYLARSLNAVVVERKMIQDEVAHKPEGAVRTTNEGGPKIVLEDSLLGDGKDQLNDHFEEDKSENKEESQPNLNTANGIYTRCDLTIQRVETHLLDLSPIQKAPLGKKDGERIRKATGEEQKDKPLCVGETLSARNLRVAVVGNVDAGKSTMIGTLTSSLLDDGRGSSRTSIMKHRHEIESGRTSTASTHLMGFRSSGQAIAGKDSVRANRRKTEDEIARESYRVITLMDLAGHEKYLKTT